jgi:hypothetical protein
MQNPLLSIITPALSTLIFLLIPLPSYAQKYTTADLERICGTKMEIKSSGSVNAYRNLDRQVQSENARVDACISRLLAAEANREKIDTIPIGGKLPNAYINGVPIRKCSHGGVCNGQMLEQMRINSY